MGKDNFGISSKYDGDLAYRIVVVRYAMLGNRFARYKEVKIATDVSDKTVAYVNEHMDTLSGISVNEDMIRKYNYSEYFSSIIGYTTDFRVGVYGTSQKMKIIPKTILLEKPGWNSITRPICVGKTVSGNSISIMWEGFPKLSAAPIP